MRGRLLKLEQYITVEKTLKNREKTQKVSLEEVTQLDYTNLCYKKPHILHR